jgi:hypothetical protein
LEPINIQPRRTLRQGIEFTFRGCEPDADGNPVGELVDIELTCPPLNLDGLERFEQKLKTFGQAQDNNIQSMRVLVDALAFALQRNYTGVPRWLISQTIDLANMPDMMRALMDLSGMRRKQIEDEKKALMSPPIPTPDSTGSNSTAT